MLDHKSPLKVRSTPLTASESPLKVRSWSAHETARVRLKVRSKSAQLRSPRARGRGKSVKIYVRRAPLRFPPRGASPIGLVP